MIARLRCWIDGHDPELIAWDVRNRTETWACARCPWADLITRKLGEHDRTPPATVGHREAWEFALAIAGVFAVVLAIAFAGGSRP